MNVTLIASDEALVLYHQLLKLSRPKARLWNVFLIAGRQLSFSSSTEHTHIPHRQNAGSDRQCLTVLGFMLEVVDLALASILGLVPRQKWARLLAYYSNLF